MLDTVSTLTTGQGQAKIPKIALSVQPGIALLQMSVDNADRNLMHTSGPFLRSTPTRFRQYRPQVR